MGINPMKWKTRNIFYSSLTFLILYVLFLHKKKHQVMFEGKIHNSNPMHVWEYVADFSNMMKLNPTIEDFTVTAESNTFAQNNHHIHWKYSVEYTEHLSQIPIIRNTAHGHYSVRQDNNGYLITSKHHTCFLSKFGCLESISQFRFDRDGSNDTKCIETVQYECPIAFSPLCYKEVMYQRKEIMRRLELEFSLPKVKND